jgi:hypothetical protein
MMPLASKLLHPDASGKNRWRYSQFFQNISQVEWRRRSCCYRLEKAYVSYEPETRITFKIKDRVPFR